MYAAKNSAGEKISRAMMESILNELFNAEVAQIKTGKVPKKERDKLFDAICLACGLDPKEAGATMGSTIGSVAASLLAATPDVTPAEVNRRAQAYRRVYPTAPCTPTALLKHWSAFAPKDKNKPVIDPYAEPDNWREKARRAFTGYAVDWDAKAWSDLAIDVRTDIIKKNA